MKSTRLPYQKQTAVRMATHSSLYTGSYLVGICLYLIANGFRFWYDTGWFGKSLNVVLLHRNTVQQSVDN